MSRIALIGLPVLGLFATAAPAATLHVDPSGATTAFVTIQSAIDAALNGDTIMVAAGVYNEAIDFLGKEITVVSMTGPASTVIDGAGTDASVVSFVNGETALSVLDGFTISHGEGTDVEIAPEIFQRHGLGIFCDGADPIVQNCIVTENDLLSAVGGGMANINDADPTIIACEFVNNNANLGGAIANRTVSSPTIRHSLFHENTAQTGAGISNSSSSSPNVANCQFWENTATTSGGAMHNSFASSPVVINCTIVNNEAVTGFGGGLFNNASDPVIVNTILWENTDVDGTDSSAQIHVTTGAPTVTYSIVQGGWTGAGGTGVLNADPLFSAPLTRDFTLTDFSPAIDSGDNASVPGDVIADLDGNDRFINDAGVTDLGNGAAPIVDLGAWERQVNSTSTFIQIPLDFPTIQEGINAADPAGALIQVSPGVYPETLNTLGKVVNIKAVPGPGGVTVDGGGAGNVITVENMEGLDTIIDGLTIINGGAPGGSGIRVRNASSPTIRNCMLMNNDAGFGGGIRISQQSNPVVTNCSFVTNTAGLGGGIYAVGQSLPAISGCSFTQNTAGIGGGIYMAEQSVVSITDCSFMDNTALGSGFGGAIFSSDCSPDILRCDFYSNNAINGGAMLLANSSNSNVFNCFFAGNDAENNGGGLACDTSAAPVVANCVFTGNTGRFGGGINSANGSSPDVINCTLSRNTADNEGGGLYMNGGELVVINSIVWQNAPDQIFEVFTPPGATVIYSDVQGGWPGTQNINFNPQFVDSDGPDNIVGSADDNLRVTAGSPVIDEGSDFLIPAGVTTDLDGNARIAGAHVDMGAYEFAGGPPPCPGDLSGNGSVDFADILQVIGAWGPCIGCPEDLDGSGDVGFGDILFVIGAWGPC